MEIEDKALKKALNELGKDFVLELTKQLLNADKKATGDLIRSLDYKVVETVDGLFLEIIALDYLKYVDEGRRPGLRPPIKAIQHWVNVKGIQFKGLKPNQTAFVIANSIAKKGIKPTNVIKKSMDNIFNNKMQLLADASVEDIQELIKKILI